MTVVDLTEGFQIEEPEAFVRWGMTKAELLETLPTEPQHVAEDYYVIDCTSLQGLQLALGFHFRPKENPALRELEFFRRSSPGLHESYAEFQRHLEAIFGAPAQQSPGDEGLPNCSWQSGGATVRHYVLNRFGPEEHVRMMRG
jgi:hypothetical protein